LLLAAGCAANGKKADVTVCKSKTAIELSASLKIGTSRADVIKLLEQRKLEFWLESEQDKDSRKRGRSSNKEFHESEFLLTAVTDRNDSNRVRSVEFFNVGFGLANTVERTGCSTAYTLI
jgi:hypothetical protein